MVVFCFSVCVCVCVQTHSGDQDLNSGPQAAADSTLPTKPYLEFFCLVLRPTCISRSTVIVCICVMCCLLYYL